MAWSDREWAWCVPRSVQVAGDLITPPIVVLLRPPGAVRGPDAGMAVSIGDVGRPLRMTSQHSGLGRDIKGPRLRIHSAAGGGAVGAARVAQQDEVTGAPQRTHGDTFIEAEIRVG